MKHIIFNILLSSCIFSGLYPSAASTGDDACAAVASHSSRQDFLSELPDEIFIQQIRSSLSPKDINQLLSSSKRMAARKPVLITAISKSIIWPDDIDERNRYYCIEKMIDLELNLWTEETGPHKIPEVVAETLRNKLSLERLGSHFFSSKFSYSRDENNAEYSEHTKVLALAIMLDKNPAIDVNEKFYAPFRSSRYILDDAIEYGTAPLIHMLCNRGATVHAVEDTFLNTPIHRAVFRNNIDTLQELIRQGARVTARDLRGLTALHHAVFHPVKLQATILLLEHGANPYTLTPYGISALGIALARQREEACNPHWTPNTSLTAVITYLEEFMTTHPPELYE